MPSSLPSFLAFTDEIQKIRGKLQELKKISLTSLQFQDDLLDLVAQNSGHGDCIIEVGCYHGGLTAQLALVAQKTGKTLFSIDNESSHIGIAERTVKATTPEANVQFFHGTFGQFVKTSDSKIKSILVLVDGLHTYEGVMQDIEALYSMTRLPHIAVFHDFGLRREGWDIGIDRALFDSFGQNFKYHPIGGIGGSSPDIPTKAAPDAWEAYFMDGAPEAIYIHCADCSLKSEEPRAIG